MSVGQTLTEKILSRAMGRSVRAGEVIYPEPDVVTVHDYYVVNFDRALQDLGVDRLYAPDKVVICVDHEPMAVSVVGAQRQKDIRAIVTKYGIKHFYDVGRGGHGHIFPMESGLVLPGQFALGYDLHIANFGAVGALGICMINEISEVLACGSVWLSVPETVRVNLTGRLAAGVSARDLAQRVVDRLDTDMLDYAVVEYGGTALEQIGFDGRMTLCNSPLESTAKSAIVEVDACIAKWGSARGLPPFEGLRADSNATYRSVLDLDISKLAPQVTTPPHSAGTVDVDKVAGVAVHHAFVGSCANAGIDDLRDAARILRGRRVADGVRMVITPGTQAIMKQAAQEGLLEIFADAGVSLSTPGCGVCAVGMISPLASGEVSINTGTVNEYGRIGAKDADIYLASPLTVAASAVAGCIADPRDFLADSNQELTS
jgi:3-isopropylmalate/(R)-2-methylmalate dehydratase large subunit